MKSRKTLSLILALLMVLTVLPLTVFSASAQECIWDIYVGDQAYTKAQIGAGAVPGLSFSGSTLTMNNYEGTSIAAIPGGFYGDDDAPVLNINLVGTNKLTGSYFSYISGGTNVSAAKPESGTVWYGALYSETRAGGYGDDSVINISGTGTLDISAVKNYTRQAVIIGGTPSIKTTVSDVDIKAVCCSELNVTGGKVYITFGGNGVSAQNVTGVEADVNVTGGVLDIKASVGAARVQSASKSSSCSVYGVNGNVLSKTYNGYFSSELASVITSSADIAAVKGNASYQNVIGALYLSAPAKGKTVTGSMVIPSVWTENYSYRKFAFSDDKYVYEAYGPTELHDLETNTCLTEIDPSYVKDRMIIPPVGEDKIFETAYTLYSEAGFFMKEQSYKVDKESGQAWLSSSWTKYELNDADSAYEFDAYVMPTAGNWYVPARGNMDAHHLMNTFGYYEPYSAWGLTAGIEVYIVYDEPAVVKQPENCEYVKNGDGPVFSVTASGSALDYQWYWGEDKLEDGNIGYFSVSGANTGTLTIKVTGESVGEAFEEEIYCVISGLGGEVTTKKVKVVVIEPKFTTQPVNSTAVNHVGTFTAVFEKTSGVTYQWYTDYDYKLTDTTTALAWDLSGTKTNTLTVAAKTPFAYENGSFYCVATYKGVDFKSDTASLIEAHECNANLEKVAAKAADCTQTGLKSHYRCMKCGKLYSDSDATKPITEKDVTIGALGHKWNSGVVTTAPTATTPGVRTYTCSECGTAKTEEIKANVLTSSNVTLSATGFQYNATTRKPTVTVKNASGKVLTEGTSYTVAYDSGWKIGTYSVTVTGKGNYSGTVKKNYYIVAQTIKPENVTLSATGFQYNATTRKPTVTVKSNTGTVLTEGVSYKLTYNSGWKIGSYSVTVTGIGNYTGSVTKNYQIVAQTIKPENVTLSASAYQYNATTRKPTVTVKSNTGTVLTEGNSYKVTYNSGWKIGSYSVTVTGIGNYTGSVTKNYQIVAQKLKAENITLSATAYQYNTTTRKPTVKVKNNAGTVLTEGTSYTVTYNSGWKIGTYSVTVTGKGNYSGTVTKTYQIVPQTLKAANITLSKTSFTYNGKIQQPTVNVKSNTGTALTEGTSYIIAYSSGCKAKGTYYAVITGIGNYTGTITKTFTIK